jgi:predicted DsbA family dithiol-disulfide isomerase
VRVSKPVRIEVVVCPWCFIGKKRLEQAVAMTPDIPVEVHYRPYFLNDWIPLEGMSRQQISHNQIRLAGIL